MFARTPPRLRRGAYPAHAEGAHSHEPAIASCGRRHYRGHRHANHPGDCRHRARQPNALNFDVRALLYQLVGVDLTQIHGIGPYLALRLVADRSEPLAHRPSLHLLADPGSWLPDQRRQSALGTHAQDQESGNSPSPVSRRNHWQNEHSVGRFLSTLVSLHRQGQCGDRHCAQDRHPVLQHDAFRYGLSGSRCRSL